MKDMASGKNCERFWLQWSEMGICLYLNSPSMLKHVGQVGRYVQDVLNVVLAQHVKVGRIFGTAKVKDKEGSVQGRQAGCWAKGCPLTLWRYPVHGPTPHQNNLSWSSAHPAPKQMQGESCWGRNCPSWFRSVRGTPFETCWIPPEISETQWMQAKQITQNQDLHIYFFK